MIYLFNTTIYLHYNIPRLEAREYLNRRSFFQKKLIRKVRAKQEFLYFLLTYASIQFICWYRGVHFHLGDYYWSWIYRHLVIQGFFCMKCCMVTHSSEVFHIKEVRCEIANRLV